MRRLVGAAKRHLSKEPSKDFSRWFYLVGGGLILFQAAFLWIKYSTEPTEAYLTFISFAAGLSFIAIGLAESLPARWHAGIAALRAAQLVLALAFGVVFVFMLLNWSQT